MKKLAALLLMATLSFNLVVCAESDSDDAHNQQESTVTGTDETTKRDGTEAAPDDETFATELISETWYNVSLINSKNLTGGRMYFNENGIARFKNGSIVQDFEWDVKDNCVILKYEANGVAMESKFPIRLNQGRYEMTDESGTYVYVKESDAKTKLSDVPTLSEIEFGTYEQDNIEDDGKEVICWVVLDDSSIPGYTILVSYYGLDVQPYNTEDTAVTWETSSLRNWLNEDFYNVAFSDDEKAVISPISIENPASRKYGTEGGSTTTDNVWILGEYDADKYMSFMSEHDGQVPTTDYVKELVGKERTCYWLRTPGPDSNKASVAYDDSNFGEIYSNVTSAQVVRPAILVSNDAEVFMSYCYEDTTNDPKDTTSEKVAPQIGMTADEVRASTWGSPKKINTTINAYGTHEQWVYKNGFIYLDDGIVTSIQFSE